MTTTAISTSVSGTRAGRTMSSRIVAYAGMSLRHTLSDVMFLFFTIALPVVMYLIFSGIYGAEITRQGTRVAGLMMVTMAAYGGLGAAMNSGFQIQLEQRSGWFRQLTLAGVSPTGLIVVRVLTASVVIVPAIIALFLTGFALQNVRMPLWSFVGSGLTLWIALIPMVLIGLAIALWFAGAAGQALNTILLLVLSMLGGLWFPIDFFPEWMQTISKTLPSYWIGQLGTAAVQGDAIPWNGVAVLLGWVVVLAGLCILGYRYAVRHSRR